MSSAEEPYTPQTFAQRLLEVQEAISEVMAGQSTSITTQNGTVHEYTKANLRDLMQYESWLLRKVAAEQAATSGRRGGMRAVKVRLR